MKNTMKEKPKMTKQQAAAFLGVSVSTFDRLRNRHGITAIPLPLKLPAYFWTEDVESLLTVRAKDEAKAILTATFGQEQAAGIISVVEAKRRAGRRVAR